MRFDKKHILVISPEPWGKSHVSKHHYAKELAKSGAKVFFLNAPSDSFSKMTVLDNLIIVDYKSKYRGLSMLPSFLSAILIKNEVEEIERKLGVVFDIIWNFDTSRFFNLSKISSKIKICHVVDMAENHQRSLLAKTSDICFCTSDYIKKELKPYNSKVFKIHHGYQSVNTDLELKEFFDVSKIQVGIVGNLARDCMDWDSILTIITEHSEIEFNFIGGTGISNLSNKRLDESKLRLLNGFSNVKLLGQKDSRLIPSYLKMFDLLLCAYKVENEEDIAQHSNLHKTMEYLGSGKLIITSYVDEYKNDRGLLLMTTPYGDVSSLFKSKVSELESYNRTVERDKRIDFANRHSYENQLLKIEKILVNNDF